MPYADSAPTEHSMVTLLPWKEDQLFAVWLDARSKWEKRRKYGRNGERGTMSLRSAIIDANEAIATEAELDARVCDCCPTDAALLPNGAIVAYRDRSENEVRDISIVRFENGKWSAPQTVYADGWKIQGCPVNGPAVATQGENVAVAWMEASEHDIEVRLRRVKNDGSIANFLTVVPRDADGLPRMARSGDDLIFAWTKRGEHRQVQTAKVNGSAF